MTPKYVIITPVRDEEAFVSHVLRSVASQTFRPTEWVIVNDGSRDRTGEILDEFAGAVPWIHVIHRPDRGFRKPGGGVMEAFKQGYATLLCEDWQFLVKLDADLSLPPDYFERCFEHFAIDHTLGIGGGCIFHDQSGKLTPEPSPRFHVRGATKIYRRECWDRIGGLWHGQGWDTIDEVKANMLGWRTQSFSDLHLLHHRHTGTAGGKWTNLVKDGRADYSTGYHPFFMLAKCLHRVHRKPYLVGALALFHGYSSSWLRGVPRGADREVVRYVHRQQLQRLLGRETIWR